ncbi:acyltransferase [Halomonas sp. 86]|uniref:acyltransferase n=1 Tax=unclassified Halomonas TaxID=2609666 RepID=UPI0040333CA7
MKINELVYAMEDKNNKNKAFNEFCFYTENRYGVLKKFEIAIIFHYQSMRNPKKLLITDTLNNKVMPLLKKNHHIKLEHTLLNSKELQNMRSDDLSGGVCNISSKDSFLQISTLLIKHKPVNFLLHFEYDFLCSLDNLNLFLLLQRYFISVNVLENEDVFISFELRSKPELNKKLIVEDNSQEFKTLEIDSRGENNFVYLSPGVKLPSVKLKIQGSNNFIMIGTQSEIKGKLHIQGDNSKILIGKRNYFTNNEARLFAQENNMVISIGDDCLFGKVLFRTSDSHSIFTKGTRDRINPAISITIKNKVWMSEDIKVFKGVLIEDGIIVAANSLVTKSLTDSFSIYGGSPAKVIKKDVEWCEERV